MSDVTNAALIGAGAALAGAASTGALQLLLARGQWKRQQTAENLVRRHEIYIEFLTVIARGATMVRHGPQAGGATFRDLAELEDDIETRLLLYGSPEVIELVGKFPDVADDFFVRVGVDRYAPLSVSVDASDWLAAWDLTVGQMIKDIAAAMRRDLKLT